MAGRALAWIIAAPGMPPVTNTLVEVAFAAKLTVDGTAATEGFEELMLIVNPPAGAGADRLSVNAWEPAVAIVALFGEKPILPVTATAWLEEVYPEAEAAILALPTFTPVTWGCVAGVVWPAEIVTVDGEIVTLELSLLVS